MVLSVESMEGAAWRQCTTSALGTRAPAAIDLALVRMIGAFDLVVVWY